MTVNALPKHTSITFLYKMIICTHVDIINYHDMENYIMIIDISIKLHIISVYIVCSLHIRTYEKFNLAIWSKSILHT